MSKKLNRIVVSVVTMALAMAMAMFLPQAQAMDGHLDPTFGERGQIELRLGGYSRLAVGKDGSIAVLSGYAKSQVRRYLSDGRPDPRFGQAGRLVLPNLIEGSPYESADLALDSSGKVLVFGSAYPPGYPTITIESTVQSVPISQGLVMRLRKDGDLDPTFGENAGAVISDFGLRSEDPNVLAAGGGDLPTTRVLDGVVDSRDRPLLLAGTAGSYSACIGHGGYASFPRGVVRLSPAGAPDPGFSDGDGVSPVPRFSSHSPLGLTLGSADRPLVVGAEGRACPMGALVLRLDVAGVPLPGFGPEGMRFFLRKRFGRFGAFDPSGAVIFQQGFPVERVFRTTPTGSVDHSFGMHGFASVSIPRGTHRVLRVVAVDPRGRILLLGSYSRPAPEPGQETAFLVVERLLRSGRPDPRFGRGGMISAPIPGAQVLGAKRAALDGAGRLVVLSEVRKPSGSATLKATLVRFRLVG